MCSSISKAKALKKISLRFALFNFSQELQTEHFLLQEQTLTVHFFGNKIKKYGVIVQKSFLKKKYIEIKNSQIGFYLLYVKLATVQFESNATNSLWLVAL